MLGHRSVAGPFTVERLSPHRVLGVDFGEPDITILRPKSGRIAVKVINHLGDEVMKVFGVS